ncbi:MAG: hypothetical protein WCW01_04865 [Gammaproteobacteria bacterium]
MFYNPKQITIGAPIRVSSSTTPTTPPPSPASSPIPTQPPNTFLLPASVFSPVQSAQVSKPNIGAPRRVPKVVQKNLPTEIAMLQAAAHTISEEEPTKRARTQSPTRSEEHSPVPQISVSPLSSPSPK